MEVKLHYEQNGYKENRKYKYENTLMENVKNV